MEKVKVLIADDNENLLSGLQIELGVLGYEVVTCTNADLAVAYAAKDRPDVMLADIWMDPDHRLILSPAGNGFALLDRISKLPETCGIPIIYITGNNSLQLDLMAKEMGAYGLIHKPINVFALSDMIDAAVSESRARSGALADAESIAELQISAARDVSKDSEA